jgi:electron transfer flavoprotein beta subunit
MKILVCVKQVLDGEAPVHVDASGRWFAPEATPVWRMNAFDAFAVEEALRIRERVPDTTIDAISVGPERAAAVLTRALEMGADAGVHLVTESEGRLSPRAVASRIAAWAGPRNYDLILTGAMSEDVMDAQVGPMLAELLGRPWATAVMRMDLSGRAIDAYPPLPDGPEASGAAERPPRPPASAPTADGPYRTLYVERELEGGVREALVLGLPALVAVQSGINRPRYPALSHVLRARKQPLITAPSAPSGAMAERERVAGVYETPPSRTGLFLEGSPEDKARRLLELLEEKALL